MEITVKILQCHFQILPWDLLVNSLKPYNKKPQTTKPCILFLIYSTFIFSIRNKTVKFVLKQGYYLLKLEYISNTLKAAGRIDEIYGFFTMLIEIPPSHTLYYIYLKLKWTYRYELK